MSSVLTALVGGLFALNGVGGLTIGGLMAFLQLNRSFNGPITQVSQQLNFVLMALAGADRIFDLLDEAEEVDQGKVTLVNYELVDGSNGCDRQENQPLGLEAPTSKWRLRVGRVGRKCGLSRC
ncbi:MAG: hypothetical protein ACLUP5_09200 [Streptococcus sp.]